MGSIISEITRIEAARDLAIRLCSEKGAIINGNEKIEDLVSLIAQLGSIEDYFKLRIAPSFPTENILSNTFYIIYNANEVTNILNISTLDDLILAGCSYSWYLYANSEWVEVFKEQTGSSESGGTVVTDEHINALIDAKLTPHVTDAHINGLIDAKTSGFLTLDSLPKYDGGVR